MPRVSFAVMATLLLVAYVVLLRMSVPHAGEAPPADAPITVLPSSAPRCDPECISCCPWAHWCGTLSSNSSPTRAAFWATLFLAFIVLTQRPLLALFRGQRDIADAAWQGLQDLVDGLAGAPAT